MKSNLPIAFAIKKKSMKGGMNKPSPEMVEEVMRKHMNCGGMAKYSKGGMVDADEPESMAQAPEFYSDDFLSDEEQDHVNDMTYPDPDHKEDTEGMGKKGILASVMQKIRMRHMGK